MVPLRLASEQDSTLNISFVYLNKSFVKNLNSNLKSASDHILYAQIRTIRWLIKVLAWGFLFVFCFVIHTTCYCMDAIRLGGNVWIKLPLRPGKWQLWEHDRPTVGLGESSCGYSHIYIFNQISMRVLNCGYICRVVLILKYIHRGIYVWKVFSSLLFLCVCFGNCCAEMQFSAHTVTTSPVERLVIVIERTCVCHRTIR
jgi:hypothetical protein